MMVPLANSGFLELIEVAFSYPGNEFSLQGINQLFQQGEFTAIIGANGTGKTTLGKLLAGIIKPEQGQVLIAGRDSREISLGQVGKLIGYLFQQPDRQLFTPTVREEIGFVLEFNGSSPEVIEKKVNDMLDIFSLADLAGAAPYQLSAGEKQRLALAALLVNQPQFLILDEPTTGLDPVRKQKLAEVLKELRGKGIGLVVISHDLSFIRSNADQVLVMAGGGLIAA